MIQIDVTDLEDGDVVVTRSEIDAWQVYWQYGGSEKEWQNMEVEGRQIRSQKHLFIESDRIVYYPGGASKEEIGSSRKVKINRVFQEGFCTHCGDDYAILRSAAPGLSCLDCPHTEDEIGMKG